MHVQEINETTLAELPTLITSFMCDTSTHIKSYADLVTIFSKCHRKITKASDASNDLRILNFESDMKKGAWKDALIITRDARTNIVIDGIHRGVAYLRCIEQGVSASQLPRVVLITTSAL